MTGPSIDPQPRRLAHGALGVAGIVFLVLAAVAPLTAMAVVAALGIAFGNGGGLPAAFLLCGAALLLFSVGYARMSHHIVSAGAFYVYVTRAAGRPLGLACAFIAVISYNSFTAGAAGSFGFFAHETFNTLLGIDLPWQAWTALLIAAVGVLGYLSIDVSAKVLGVSLILETLVLVVFDFSVLWRHGFDFSAFHPDVVFSGSFGIGLLFAIQGFLGFEATALFGEEARDPQRTIPRATYTAIVLIAVFYALTTLAIVSAAGVDQAREVAARDPGAFVFGLAREHLCAALTDAMQFLLLISLFAATLALHNMAGRYLFALGRAKVLPQALGRIHPRIGSPHVASLTQTGFNAIVAFGFMVAGAHPLIVFATSMTGFATLGIIVLQASAAIAVVVFYRRRRDRRVWSTGVLPGLGGAALVAICVIVVQNFGALTGSDSVTINRLPWILVTVAAGGIALGLWLRVNRPQVYAQLGHETDWLTRHPAPDDLPDASVRAATN